MLTFNFLPFPVLFTERLVLREFNNSDIDDFHLMRSDVSLMQHIARPISKTREETIALIQKVIEDCKKGELINWVVASKKDGRLMGTIGYYRMKPEHHRAEVGYMLNAEHHQKGLMTEALQSVIDYGFNKMNLHSIEAVIDPENTASERLLQKLNFVKEAHFKENEMFEGKYLDSVVYSLLGKI